MLTLLLGKNAKSFRISHQEMIKGVRLGGVGKTLAFFNTLEVPIIENTAREEDLTESMAQVGCVGREEEEVLTPRPGHGRLPRCRGHPRPPPRRLRLGYVVSCCNR